MPLHPGRRLYQQRFDACLILAAAARRVGDLIALRNHLAGAAMWKRQYRDALRYHRKLKAEGFAAFDSGFNFIRLHRDGEALPPAQTRAQMQREGFSMQAAQ